MKCLENSNSFYYIIVDLEGKYLYVNELFKEKFSFISPHFIGQLFSTTIHPEDVEKCNKAAEEIIYHQEKILKLEIRKPDGQGKFYWTEWEFSGYFNQNKELQGIQCIGYNIADLVEQKEKLAQVAKEQKHKNEELKKINSELDNFVYRVSHDLRSPISSLQGLNQLIRNACEMERLDMLDLQQKSLHRLDKFIKDILDYSRNNRITREENEIDLKVMIEEIIENNSLHASHEIDIQVGHLPIVEQDRFRLTIILNNLISNAFKYIYRGQNNPQIKVNGYLTDGYCHLSIKDNGIGIKSSEQSKIFDMFYRATDRESGSGIGLYIVQEALTIINGTVEVDSSFGEGSEFKIKFPILNNQ